MADEASVVPDTAQPAADKAPGKVYSQADVDNLTNLVRESTQKKLQAEFEERVNREKMSEAEKIRADYEAEKAKRTELESKLTQVERSGNVARAASAFGYVPDEYLERAANAAASDAKPEDIAKAAFEKFTADAARLKPGEPVKATPRTGPISDGSMDLSQLDDAALNRLAVTKGGTFYKDHIKPEWDRRRLRAAGKA
jgi:hypothetical protein